MNLNEVLAGVQLQLLTYLDAVCKESKTLPAGIFYLGLIDKMVEMPSSASDEHIKEELRKQFKMQGLILADAQIVRKMDTNLVTGKSNIIDVAIKKDGAVSEKWWSFNIYGLF